MSQVRVFFGVSAIHSMLEENEGARKLLELAFDRSINIVTCSFVVETVLRTLEIVSGKTSEEYPLRLHLRILFQESNNVFEFVDPSLPKIKQFVNNKMPGPVAVKVASILKCKPHYFATQNKVFLNDYHTLITQRARTQVYTPEVVYAAILRQFKQI